MNICINLIERACPTARHCAICVCVCVDVCVHAGYYACSARIFGVYVYLCVCVHVCMHACCCVCSAHMFVTARNINCVLLAYMRRYTCMIVCVSLCVLCVHLCVLYAYVYVNLIYMPGKHACARVFVCMIFSRLFDCIHVYVHEKLSKDTQSQTDTCKHKNTHTRARTRTHTHTHTHTYTHTYLSLRVKLVF